MTDHEEPPPTAPRVFVPPPAASSESLDETADSWFASEPPRAPDLDTVAEGSSISLETPRAPLRQASPEPLALDGFVHGIEPLDGLVVFSLSDGAVYGSWVRPDAGFSADDVARTLREAYRASLQAARRLAIFSAAAVERTQAAEPAVMIETPAHTVLLRRIRAYVVACLFDGSLPLGMARLCAARLASSLEPELPRTDLDRLTLPPPAAGAEGGSRGPNSMRFTAPRKAPHASAAEVDHVRRVIAHAEARLPDPHTVRLRLSLRSHTPRLALDHPETMASDAVLRVETAVLDMLGIDREELGLALLGEQT